MNGARFYDGNFPIIRDLLPASRLLFHPHPHYLRNEPVVPGLVIVMSGLLFGITGYSHHE
jgi:hypothetical protein